jgi:hypothetical protein
LRSLKHKGLSKQSIDTRYNLGKMLEKHLSVRAADIDRHKAEAFALVCDEVKKIIEGFRNSPHYSNYLDYVIFRLTMACRPDDVIPDPDGISHFCFKHSIDPDKESGLGEWTVKVAGRSFVRVGD